MLKNTQTSQKGLYASMKIQLSHVLQNSNGKTLDAVGTIVPTLIRFWRSVAVFNGTTTARGEKSVLIA